MLLRHGKLWATFNANRHFIIGHIDDIVYRKDGETVGECFLKFIVSLYILVTLVFNGVAVTDSVSGSCYVTDRIHSCEGYNKLTLPMIQLVSIPREVTIVRGMYIKIFAGLITRKHIPDQERRKENS